MTDSTGQERDRRSRVDEAFADLRASLDRPLPPEVSESLDRLQAAIGDRDAEAARRHLETARERHGWLYEELARHPKISVFLSDLALLGF